jgi:hypothetical protein
MPKSQPRPAPSPSPSRNGDRPQSSSAVICAQADALFRAACECCRQHERLAKMVEISELDAEHRTANDLVRLCDAALDQAVSAYEKTTSRAHPDGDDEAWWHKANALWSASREYLLRHTASDRASRRVSPQAPTKLGELQMDYELEASALLALQQATDAYRKLRPHVDCLPRR